MKKIIILLKNILRPSVIAIQRTRIAFLVNNKAWMDDKKYIQKKYFRRFHTEPNLENPVSFNEKNNWRKLYDRKAYYSRLVDKCEFKRVVLEKLGPGYTFNIIKVWNAGESIRLDELPEQFVLKATNTSNVFICHDKETFDFDTALKNLKVEIKKDYSLPSREWPYKGVNRRIIAEEYMGSDLVDYKNYCFNGKVQYTFVWQNIKNDDGSKPKAYFCGAYDRKWNKTDIEIDYPSMDVDVQKPGCYDEMIRCAEKMSYGIPFVRCDCYILRNKVYIGEMTFFPWGGFMKFKDERWNRHLGELEDLTIPMRELTQARDD